MEQLTQFATDWKTLFIGLHIYAVVLGLGGATYSDILLAHFLKDLKISKKEAGIISLMSKVLFLGLFLALVSGLFIFISNPTEYLNSSKFISKMIIFGVISINGILLHAYVLPRMLELSFHSPTKQQQQGFRFRKRGAILGAVSVVSWYTVFVLGVLRSIPVNVPTAMMLYGVFLLIAIVIALTTEEFMHRRFSKHLKS